MNYRFQCFSIPEQVHFELRARRLPEQGPVVHSSSFWRKKHTFALTFFLWCVCFLTKHIIQAGTVLG